MEFDRDIVDEFLGAKQQQVHLKAGLDAQLAAARERALEGMRCPALSLRCS